MQKIVTEFKKNVFPLRNRKTRLQIILISVIPLAQKELHNLHQIRMWFTIIN